MEDPSTPEIIERLAGLSTSVAESFFIDQRLGQAFASPGKGWGVRKRVNAALLAAERDGRFDEVLAAARSRFEDSPKGPKAGVAQMGKIGRQPGGKLFVPHASADKEIAEAVADLLRLGTDLTSKHIVCTSLAGMGVPEGTSDYAGYLRGELADAHLVVPLLTPAFFDSDVCLVELGAMWGMQLEAFPLVVPPATYSRLEAAVGKVQGGRVDDPRVLDRLRDRVVEIFELDPKTDMWAQHRESFDQRLPSLLEQLAPPQRVPASELEKAMKDLAAASARAKKARKEFQDLKERFESVVALKDAAEVAEIMTSDDEQQRFDAAVQAAQAATDLVPPVVRRSLYENYGRNEDFRPDQWDIDDAENAVRNDLLRYDPDTGGYWYNEDDPAVEDAVAALVDVFDYPWSSDLEENFKKKHKKRFGRAVKPAWEALGLL